MHIIAAIGALMALMEAWFGGLGDKALGAVQQGVKDLKDLANQMGAGALTALLNRVDGALQEAREYLAKTGSFGRAAVYTVVGLLILRFVKG